MPAYQFANTDQAVPSADAIAVEFAIHAPLKTDIWSRPPATARFNAPLLYQELPLQAFRRVRVSLVADWTTKYDQGGVALIVAGGDDGADGTGRRWIKAGIEFVDGRPHVSVVAKDRWADWSLHPLRDGGAAATIELVRDSDDGGIWVYLVEGVSRVPLREVTWLGDAPATADCWIGTYAAKPADHGDALTVHFRHFLVERIAE
jgi:uncharacterized protein